MTHLGELLSAYLDGELRPSEHNRVISHLALCAPCQDDLGDLHHARSVVRSLPTIEAPQWVLGGESEVAPEHGRRPIAWAAAVAAAVLVVTIGIATWLTPVPELEMSYDEIANTHRVRASQDGTPTGARLVQIVQFSPAGAE